MSRSPECAATFFKTWRSTLVGHLGLQSVTYRVDTPCKVNNNQFDLAKLVNLVIQSSVRSEVKYDIHILCLSYTAQYIFIILLDFVRLQMQLQDIHKRHPIKSDTFMIFKKSQINVSVKRMIYEVALTIVTLRNEGGTKSEGSETGCTVCSKFKIFFLGTINLVFHLLI